MATDEMEVGTFSGEQYRAVAMATLDQLLSRRSEFARRAGNTHDDHRKVWKELGYPDRVDPETMYLRYLRGDVASTIVDEPPQQTWGDVPEIKEMDDAGQEVGDSQIAHEFMAWASDIALWHYLERADRVSRTGEYGVILLGSIRSDGDLATPLFDDDLKDLSDIAFLAVYRQSNAEVNELVSDKGDARYMLPETYGIRMVGDAKQLRRSRRSHSADSARDDGPQPEGNGARSNASMPGRTEVHWSRILHVVDDPLESDLLSRPALERVWNRLLDLDKSAGGSAELFWTKVAGVWHANVDPATVRALKNTASGEDPLEELGKKIVESMHGIRRFLGTKGVDLKQVGGGTPDPSGIFDVQKALIAAGSRIPQAILFGQERGELASSKDERTFLGRIEKRRQRFATPLVMELIQRFQEAELLEATPEGHSLEVEWPNLFQLTEEELANVMDSEASARRSVAMGRMQGAPVTTEEEDRELLGLPPERPDSQAMSNWLEEEDEATVRSIEEHRRSAEGS